MELEKINSDTQIKNFDSIYNSNNNLILEYISSLESNIETLSNEITRINNLYSNKISSLNTSIKKLKDIVNNNDEKIEFIYDYIKNHKD